MQMYSARRQLTNSLRSFSVEMISAEVIAIFVIAFSMHCPARGTEADDLIVDPEKFYSFSTLPPLPQSYDSWDDWESWKPSQEIVDLFPGYRSGYDNDGLVVHVVEFGKLDLRGLATLPKEKIEEFWKSYERWTRIEERDAALNDGQGMAIIVDFEGFSLAHYASSNAMKEGLRVFTMLLRLNDAVKYGFFLNVNFGAETFLQLARPFLGNILERFEVYGTRSEKWKPVLLRKIPASQLPPVYGGIQDWKALPEMGSRR